VKRTGRQVKSTGINQHMAACMLINKAVWVWGSDSFTLARRDHRKLWEAHIVTDAQPDTGKL
jgi:hypothetical protein